VVGRDGELAEIGAAVAAAAAGEARVLAFVGEPGIGKSALLAQARERAAAAGLTVLDGRAAEHEADVPFGLAIDALDDHVGTIGGRRLESLGPAQLPALAAVLPAAAVHAEPDEAVPGPAERYRYHRATRALLELLGRERPFALLLDDVHWADDASIELVLHLLRRPPRVPHVLALASRSTGPAPRVLDALRSAPVARTMLLEPLSRDAALELLGDLDDVATRDRIATEAGGNPLYLQELARVAGDAGTPLPPTLVAAVQLEVAGLPPASRALLDGAAVAGDPFDPELAAAAGGLDGVDALVPLDRLIAADLVRPAAGERRFRFRHPLVRRAVYDAAPGGWRLAAHERAAEALAKRGAGAVARAYHVEQAARPGEEAALTVLTDAAATSLSAAPATAARWYGSALRLLPEGDDRRLALLGPLARALAATGDLEGSRGTLLDALRVQPDDVELTIACAHTEQTLGLRADAERRLTAALERLDGSSGTGARAEVELQLALLALEAGDLQAVHTRSERALAAAGDRDLGIAAGAEALLALGELWGAGPDAAHARLDRGLAGLARLTDSELAERLYSAHCLSSALILVDRNREAAELAGRAVRVAEALSREELLITLMQSRAIALHNVLELPTAFEVVEAADEMARLQGVPNQRLGVLMIRILVLDAIGDVAAARAAADEIRAIVPLVEPGTATVIALTVAAALELDADPERAIRTIVEMTGDELERAEPLWSASWLARALAEASMLGGRPQEAEHWAAAAERNAAALGTRGPAVRAATARAHALLAAGAAGEAARRATEAASDADRLDIVDDAVRARLVAGEALAAAGRRDEALAALSRAAEVAAGGGAVKLRDRAARALRRLGESAAPARARTPHSNLAALTEREREVVQLVARGQSNKQVAATLFLSEKTVEKHLYRAFDKLGVGSRTELASLLVRGDQP
jgi:DNA-binding NarL/FixJ family response regulator